MEDGNEQPIEFYLELFSGSLHHVESYLNEMLKIPLKSRTPGFVILQRIIAFEDEEFSKYIPLLNEILDLEKINQIIQSAGSNEQPILDLCEHMISDAMYVAVFRHKKHPKLKMNPWTWLDSVLNDELTWPSFLVNQNHSLSNFINNNIIFAALNYASLYCNIETEKELFHRYHELAFEKGERRYTRRLHDPKFTFDMRIKGHSLDEIYEMFD